MTFPDSQAKPSAAPFKRWLWRLLKWSLCAVVIVFVGRRAYNLWNQGHDQLESVSVQWRWLVLAGCTYAVGWLPSIWFWRKLMRSLGARIRYADVTRAYCCGHLGKYIPGKAMVLIIRAGLMKDRGCAAAPAALTATYETLLMMGAGLCIAIALSPSTGWPHWIKPLATSPIIPFVLVTVACLLFYPLIAKLLTIVAVKMIPADMLREGRDIRIRPKLIGAGLLAFVVSWSMSGLSLGFTLQAVSNESFQIHGWPVWTGAVAIATVVGFLAVFAPGGMGVREGMLLEVLSVQPDIGEKQAVFAALLLRLVWIVAEIAMATALYYMVKPPKDRPEETEVR